MNPMPRLDDILHDELVDDASLVVLLLVDYPDAIHDVVLDPNIHDEVAHDATLLLNILHDDPTLLMRCSQDTLDEVVQNVVYNLMSRYMVMTTQCQLDLLLNLIFDVTLNA